MNFFLITEINKFPKKEIERLVKCKTLEFIFGDYTCYFNEEEKFKKDRVVINELNIKIFLNGVILNKEELSYNNEKWESTILRLYSECGIDFVKQLNGSFNGFVYNPSNTQLDVFNDHIGSKPIYYKKDESLISTKISLLYDLLSYSERGPTLSVESAYCLLSYGFMLDALTLSNEILKLSPGSSFNNQIKKITAYYTLDNTPDISITKNDAIEIIDNSFQKALKQQLNKDVEYGYKHLVGLSGGLDSRMTAVVANELGFTEQTNFTFSQSDYLDETIAKKISSDLRHNWIFKHLDNGLFLKKLDEITEISGGSVLYYGLAHGQSLYELLNFSGFGLVHTGQLGDVVVGTFYSDNKFSKSYKAGDGALSKTFANKVSLNVLGREYPNQEVFNFYNRGFSGANSGLASIQNYSETMSPFYQIEMLNNALKIPACHRYGHRLYQEWILSKHSFAAKYKWEKTGQRLTAKTFDINGKAFTVKQILGIATRKVFGIDFNDVGSKNHMNPFEYWYKTNLSLNAFIEDYYILNINRVEDYELKKDVMDLFSNGTVLNKLQVISLLSAIKRFFNK